MADGSEFNINESTAQFSTPAAPTCTVPSGAGTTYFFAVGIVYEINGGYYVCAVSPYTSKTGTTGTSTIDSPTAVSGAVGWVPLYGTSTVGLPSTYTSGFAITSYIAFGTNWSGNADTNTTSQIWNGTTAIAGWTTTGGGAGFFFFGLPASTEYYFYPAYSTAGHDVLIPGAITTSASAANAIAQSGDGYIALSNGAVTLTMPAAGGGGASGGSGGSGGGKGALL
jgi:hypothetical protein